jgi:ribonuclease HII
LAKVERDKWCESIDAEFPEYGFAKHKGYGTAEHLHVLSNLGPTCWHRRSFAPVTQWINAHPQA